MTIDKRQSNILFVMKCFAVLLIVMAHCQAVPSSFSDILQYGSSALKILATGGVGIFFLISGYLFAFNTHSPGTFWKKKFKTLVAPWVFTGTLVWLYIVLRKQGLGGLNVLDWLLWIAGVKTYLWYMPMVTILFAVFLWFSKSKVFLIAVPLLSLISYFTYDLTYPYLWSWGGNYLNVFSWALVFWCGYMVGKKQWFDNIVTFACRYRILLVLLFVALISSFTAFHIPCEYGMIAYLPLLLLAALSALSLSEALCNNKIIRQVGADSFAIYLLHMPLAGIVSNLCNRVDSVILLLIRPFLIVAVLEIVLCGVRQFTKRYPKTQWINTLIGTR